MTPRTQPVTPGEVMEQEPSTDLLSEAREGAPWRPEKPHEDDPEHGAFWLTNDAGDSLYVEVADVAALLNAAIANTPSAEVSSEAADRDAVWLAAFEKMHGLYADHKAGSEEWDCHACDVLIKARKALEGAE